MAVRAARTDAPRRARPVMSPSRGPGPRSAPMYIAVPSENATVPTSNAPTWNTRSSKTGIHPSPTLTNIPTSRAFTTVPIPGRSRNGIHSSRTSSDTPTTTDPNDSPSTRDSPWWKTSHPGSPRFACTSAATLIP